jgi:hypothetical protein
MRIGFDLSPQPRDGDVDRPGQRDLLISPHDTQQVLARDDAPFTLGEASQQLDLTMPEIDFISALERPQPPEIDRDWTETDLFDSRVAAAKHGMNARQQLVERKRLGHIVVGAQFERADLVVFVPPCGEDDHRGRFGPRAQLAAHVEPGALGKHQVEQHQIGNEPRYLLDRLDSVRSALDGKAFVDQIVFENARNRRIVFDHQDALCHNRLLRDAKGIAMDTTVPFGSR